MRWIDILSWHPSGAPLDCLEHDGALKMIDGATRLTVGAYRAQEPTWQRALAAWAAQHPVSPPPEPLPPLTAVQFLALAARLLALNPETVEDDLIALIKRHIADPQARAEAIIAVRRASVFEPDHPLLRQIATAAGIDDAAFAAAWRAAAP